MRLVAFDTSGATLLTAVGTPDGDVGGAEDGRAGQASARLLPALESRLAEAGLRWGDIDAIAFGAGPGAFTGLRTACAVAQGLALGLDVPVLPLDMLQVRAEDAARAWTRVDDGPAAADPAVPAGDRIAGDGWWVAIDARMGEVYATHYARISAGVDASAGASRWRWQPRRPPALLGLDALAAALREAPPRCAIGDGFDLLPPEHRPGPAARRHAAWHDGAAALLAVARAAWADGRAVDAADAQPLYLRDKVAQTTAERLAAREMGRAGGAGTSAAASGTTFAASASGAAPADAGSGG